MTTGYSLYGWLAGLGWGLLRWLLGCGANVEVLAPAKWREVVISQLDKMRAVYGAGDAG